MNKIQQTYCTIESNTKVAENTFLLRFHSAEIAAIARPGQFVNLLTSEAGGDPFLRRPFSISRVEGESVELLYYIIGKGTRNLSKLISGESVNVIGPLGQSFRTETKHDKALIVAGGIGVAPFPFLTAELGKYEKHVESFVGFRTAGQVFTSHLKNVHIATDDGSEGYHGNVVQLLEPFLDQIDLASVKIFACGPTIMFKALTSLAQRRNVCCEVSLEGQMACGVGICQGCPVERTDGTTKYALVCKDGPTFLTTEVNL